MIIESNFIPTRHRVGCFVQAFVDLVTFWVASETEIFAALKSFQSNFEGTL